MSCLFSVCRNNNEGKWQDDDDDCSLLHGSIGVPLQPFHSSCINAKASSDVHIWPTHLFEPYIIFQLYNNLYQCSYVTIMAALFINIKTKRMVGHCLYFGVKAKTWKTEQFVWSLSAYLTCLRRELSPFCYASVVCLPRLSHEFPLARKVMVPYLCVWKLKKPTIFVSQIISPCSYRVFNYFIPYLNRKLKIFLSKGVLISSLLYDIGGH
jgi:hypothetical protein